LRELAAHIVNLRGQQQVKQNHLLAVSAAKLLGQAVQPYGAPDVKNTLDCTGEFNGQPLEGTGRSPSAAAHD
jgi:hypothetical protein